MFKLNNKGETIVETLVAVLMISLSFIMLAGAIVTASKINKTAYDSIKTFSMDNSVEISDFKLTIDDIEVDVRKKVKEYKSSGGYYYYE